MFIPHVQTNHQQMFVFVFDANPTRSQLTYCFSCGEVGKLDKLKICSQCEEAYYCNEECERVHAKARGPVCIATLAAKAKHAYRVRLAQEVRQRGKNNVEGGEEDSNCVICLEPPESPVKVRSSNSIAMIK